MVPISTPSDGARPMTVGWKWAMEVGSHVHVGEVAVSVAGDNAGMIGQAFKFTQEAVERLFAQVGTPVAPPGTHVVPPVRVAPEVPADPTPSRPVPTPAATAPAAPAAPPAPHNPPPASHPPAGEAPRRRGRPPGSRNAASTAPAAPPPQRSADDETSGFTPEPEDGEPGSEPSEPFGRSGRTLSNLMGTLVTIGRPGGAYRGKTYVEIDGSGKLDTFLEYVVKNAPKFAAGGPESAEDWEEQVRTAGELLDLRKTIGLYKPAS